MRICGAQWGKQDADKGQRSAKCANKMRKPVPVLKHTFLTGAKGQISASEGELGDVEEEEQLHTRRGRMLGRMSDAM